MCLIFCLLFSDIGYLGKLIIRGYLPVYKVYLPCYFIVYGIFEIPYTGLCNETYITVSYTPKDIKGSSTLCPYTLP